MTNRVILGQRGSDYGLWVSKEGDNVLSPTQPLLFDSTETNYFNVIKSGQVTFTLSYTRTSAIFDSFFGVWTATYAITTTQSTSSVSFGETQNYVPFVSFFEVQVASSTTRRYIEYGDVIAGQAHSSGSGAVKPFHAEITTSSFKLNCAPHTLITVGPSSPPDPLNVSRVFGYMVLGVSV